MIKKFGQEIFSDGFKIMKENSNVLYSENFEKEMADQMKSIKF